MDLQTFKKKVFAASKKGDHIYGYVESYDADTALMSFRAFDSLKHGCIAKCEVSLAEFKLLSNASNSIFFKTFKAVIFKVFDTSTTMDVMLFFSDLKKVFDNYKIPTFFGPDEWWLLSTKLAMVRSTPSIAINNVVLLVFIDPGLKIFKVKRVEDGYRFLGCNNMASCNAEVLNLEENDVLKQMDDSEAALVLLCIGDSGELNSLVESLLKVKKSFKYKEVESAQKLICRFCDHILHKNTFINWLHPFSVKRYYACQDFGAVTQRHQLALTSVLPYTVEFYTERPSPILHFIDQKSIIYAAYECPRDCHRCGITVVITEDNFIHFVAKKVLLNPVIDLPRVLNGITTDKKLPVIGFFDNSSVILTYMDDGYKFLDKWSGYLGQTLFIAFNTEKPTFCEKAVDVYKKKPSYVVHDLVHTMSFTSKESVDDDFKSKRSYEVTEDEMDPLLLAFDCYGGKRKAASPAFLMAMLIKEHLKAIKEEIGTKPNEVAFKIMKSFLKEYSNEELECIQKNMVKAFDLLKVKCVNFS